MTGLDSEVNITSFLDLPPEEVAAYRNKANWMVVFPKGETRGDWLYLEDKFIRIRTHHLKVEWDGKLFDKRNSQEWGAFVLPMRVGPDNIAEFCLPYERRVLLRDENGSQGGVFINNIPQGGIKPGESSREAAIREALEETGRKLTDTLLIGRTNLHVFDSESVQDMFLGLVSEQDSVVAQKLDSTEELEEKWHTFKELDEIDLIDGKTEAMLRKVFRVLHPGLLIPELVGPFRLDPRFLDSKESLEWYVKSDKYQQLREQTTDNYPHRIMGDYE